MFSFCSFSYGNLCRQAQITAIISYVESTLSDQSAKKLDLEFISQKCAETL